jgi:hypothetical protein
MHSLDKPSWLMIKHVQLATVRDVWLGRRLTRLQLVQRVTVFVAASA